MKIILCGALGKMGRAVTDIISSENTGAELYAAIDVRADGSDPCVVRSFSEVGSGGDVIIDFSHHSAAEEVCEYAVRRKIPAVVAATGHTKDEISSILAAAQKIPVFFCANMAAGVALLCDFAARAASFFPNADIEIVETHRRGKLDAPSGTALMLSKAIEGGNGARRVGIHSLRMGNVVGTHEIIICAGGETLTITHRVDERAVFARGALAAASFIIGRPAGLYDVRSLTNGR